MSIGRVEIDGERFGRCPAAARPARLAHRPNPDRKFRQPPVGAPTPMGALCPVLPRPARAVVPVAGNASRSLGDADNPAGCPPLPAVPDSPPGVAFRDRCNTSRVVSGYFPSLREGWPSEARSGWVSTVPPTPGGTLVSRGWDPPRLRLGRRHPSLREGKRIPLPLPAMCLTRTATDHPLGGNNATPTSDPHQPWIEVRGRTRR